MAYELGLQSSQLTDFKVTINGILMTESQVIEIKMKWNIENFKVVGYMAIKDMGNIVEQLPIRANDLIKLDMVDFDEIPTNEEVRIVDIGYNRNQSGEASVILYFVDPITLEAIKLYSEYSWKSADVVEIIDHPETLKPFLNKEKDFTSDIPKFENFVIPLNVPFNVTMHWCTKKSNVFFFQTRNKIRIKTIRELFAQPSEPKWFYYKCINNLYRRKIFELDTKYAKMLDINVLQPPGKVASFSNETKKLEYIEENYSGSVDKLNSLGNVKQNIPQGKSKHYYKSRTHIREATDFQWGKNSYKGLMIEMLVPGQFVTNIGAVVYLDLVFWTDAKQEEKNISGEWLIVEITDIIRPPDFVQRIVLARAKYTT